MINSYLKKQLFKSFSDIVNKWKHCRHKVVLASLHLRNQLQWSEALTNSLDKIERPCYWRLGYRSSKCMVKGAYGVKMQYWVLSHLIKLMWPDYVLMWVVTIWRKTEWFKRNWSSLPDKQGIGMLPTSVEAVLREDPCFCFLLLYKRMWTFRDLFSF